jgi:hypothetical protein
MYGFLCDMFIWHDIIYFFVAQVFRILRLSLLLVPFCLVSLFKKMVVGL